VPRRGTFYLARVVKGGRLTLETFLLALARPRPIVVGDHAWTITAYQPSEDGQWHYGRLTKYKPEGLVTVIDHDLNAEVEQLEPDLVIASSPFIYAPAFQGLAFLHVWNAIQRDVFPRRFAALIEHSLENFFVHCSIEAITDLRTFAKKLTLLRNIQEISARVRPTNPLFSPLWKSLREYVAQRNAETVKVEEQTDSGTLNTRLPEVAGQLAEGLPIDNIPSPENFPIGDAAILMSADGYGNGRVVGEGASGTRIVVRTDDTQVNFSTEADSDPAALAFQTLETLERLERERSLIHGTDEKSRSR